MDGRVGGAGIQTAGRPAKVVVDENRSGRGAQQLAVKGGKEVNKEEALAEDLRLLDEIANENT
jgi:hypothetical protein